jgi:superfamily II DNA or RNA helicase
MPPVISLHQVGGLYALNPPVRPAIEEFLHRALTHTVTVNLEGEELDQALAQGHRTYARQRRCYLIKNKAGQLFFQCGFFDRIEKMLHREGYDLEVIRSQAPRRRPDWQKRDPEYMKKVIRRWEAYRHERFQWRPSQIRILKIILSHPTGGQYEMPTGWGKSNLIMPLCAVLPKAKFHLIINESPVLAEIHRNLSSVFPSVGLVKAATRELDRRIVCLSGKSLHHTDYDADVVLVDEGHGFGSDRLRDQLAGYDRAMKICFSASLEMRADKKDFGIEGIFGPVRHRRTYQQAVNDKEIPPILVFWRKSPRWTVRPVPEKYQGRRDVWHKRFALWRNLPRNKMIGADARYWRDKRGKQVLITVATLEHALYLRRHGGLHDFAIVFAPDKDTSPSKVRQLLKAGLISSPSELRRSAKQADWLKRQFETGRLRGAIATSTWNVGVNFRQLQVLLRADGAKRDIDSVQIPGRLSRFTDGKTYGILIDYDDRFDTKTKNDAQHRESRYGKLGWKQIKEGRKSA